MISRAWLVAVGTIAGALALVWFARPRVVSETFEPVAAAAVSPPEPIVADTKVNPYAELPLPVRAATPGSPAVSAEPRADHVPLSELRAMPAHERLAARQRSFEAEPVDTDWARGAESELLRKLADIQGLRVVTLRVDCRTTTCRLEITLAASGGPAGGQGALASYLRPTMVVPTFDPSGAPSTLMYFARPGYEPVLPRPDTERAAQTAEGRTK
jgi:hypothetical protein